jgi:hypothetical protein
MSLNVLSILSTTANLLEKEKDTVNLNLNKKYSNVVIGVDGLHQSYPVPKSLYPVIFVEAVSKSEAFSCLGNYSERDAELSVNIIPVTEYGIGIDSSREHAANEILQITQNIENIIRDHVALSSTVESCNIESTTYGTQLREDTWNHVSIINLKIFKRAI